MKNGQYFCEIMAIGLPALRLIACVPECVIAGFSFIFILVLEHFSL